MAKPPKKRTKTKTKQSIQNAEILSVVSYCYQAVKFLGDCYHSPRAIGVQRLYTFLRGERHEKGLAFFARHLFRDMDWSLIVVCYFKINKEDEEIIAVQTHAVFEDTYAKDVAIALSDVILACVQATLKATGYTLDNLYYYTYLLMPENHPSQFDNADGLSSLMINIVDIDAMEPFKDKIPGVLSNEDTIHNAIYNNGTFPTVKKIKYWVGEEALLNQEH